MCKLFKLFGLAAVVTLVGSTPLFAADQGSAPFYGAAIAAGLGAAFTIVGAGLGFGKIGASALESMARQPEVADAVGRNMIVIAALLEGATFFSLIVCLMLFFKA